MANPRAGARRSSTPARAALGDDVELTAHFHNTRGQGLANVLAALEAGVDSFESSFGELGGCPVPAGRDRQHRHRGPRLDAARDGHRDRHRPRRRCSTPRAPRSDVLGRPLGSHTLVAGPVDWHPRADEWRRRPARPRPGEKAASRVDPADARPARLIGTPAPCSLDGPAPAGPVWRSDDRTSPLEHPSQPPRAWRVEPDDRATVTARLDAGPKAEARRCAATGAPWRRSTPGRPRPRRSATRPGSRSPWRCAMASGVRLRSRAGSSSRDEKLVSHHVAPLRAAGLARRDATGRWSCTRSRSAARAARRGDARGRWTRERAVELPSSAPRASRPRRDDHARALSAARPPRAAALVAVARLR